MQLINDNSISDFMGFFCWFVFRSHHRQPMERTVHSQSSSQSLVSRRPPLHRLLSCPLLHRLLCVASARQSLLRVPSHPHRLSRPLP